MTARAHDAAKSVTRADIEAKLAEVRGELDRETDRAKGMGLAVGAAVVTVVVIGAYLLGRRKGKKRRAVVEVQRV